MSAVREWFYLYDIVFSYIGETYGQDTLAEYLAYLAEEADSDISERIRSAGNDAAGNGDHEGAACASVREAARIFGEDFIKDGAAVSGFTLGTSSAPESIVASPVRDADAPVSFTVTPCPAWAYLKEKGITPASDYCGVCRALYGRVCANAGVRLTVEPEAGGSACVWTFAEEAQDKPEMQKADGRQSGLLS